MKVTLDAEDMSPEEIEEMRDNKPKEATKEEFKQHMLRSKEVRLSPQVVKFAAEELGMTPDEFIAMLLKQAGASQ